jgi:hypothetical protein
MGSHNMTDEPESKPEPKKTNGVGDPVVVRLRKSVIANGEDVMELTFREPTAADIERCGNPVNVDFFTSETPRMTFDAKSMSAMMSTLAAVPPSTIKQMHPRDWNTAAWNLANFFLPDM